MFVVVTSRYVLLKIIFIRFERKRKSHFNLHLRYNLHQNSGCCVISSSSLVISPFRRRLTILLTILLNTSGVDIKAVSCDWIKCTLNFRIRYTVLSQDIHVWFYGGEEDPGL